MGEVMNKTRWLIWIITVMCLVYSSHSHAASIERIEVATLPIEYAKGSLILSPDGKHYAFVVGSSGSQRIVCDGVRSQEFNSCSLPVFSSAGKLFFWGLQDGKVVLSAEGRIIPTSLAGEGAIVFSRDGMRWAAFGAELEKQNGNTFTPGKVVMFIDGVEIGKNIDISYPNFSRDGKRVAWLALDADENISLIVDGKVSTVFKKPTVECSFIMRASIRGPNMHLQSSAQYMDNGELVTLVRDVNGWTVYKADKAISSYGMVVWGGGGYTAHLLTFDGSDTSAAVQARSLVIAENAPVAAWWERPRGKDILWRVVVDGKPADSITCPYFWSAQPPILSRDGKHIAYAADFASAESEKSDVYAVIDGVKYGPYANVWGICFSDDAKHFAYAASDGKAWSYYLDGKPFAHKYSSVYRPVLSVNGAHIAWRATRDEKEVLAVNGEEVGITEEVLWGPDMQDSGVTMWVVHEGTKVFKVTAKAK